MVYVHAMRGLGARFYILQIWCGQSNYGTVKLVPTILAKSDLDSLAMKLDYLSDDCKFLKFR